MLRPRAIVRSDDSPHHDPAMLRTRPAGSIGDSVARRPAAASHHRQQVSDWAPVGGSSRSTRLRRLCTALLSLVVVAALAATPAGADGGRGGGTPQSLRGSGGSDNTEGAGGAGGKGKALVPAPVTIVTKVLGFLFSLFVVPIPVPTGPSGGGGGGGAGQTGGNGGPGGIFARLVRDGLGGGTRGNPLGSNGTDGTPGAIFDGSGGGGGGGAHGFVGSGLPGSAVTGGNGGPGGLGSQLSALPIPTLHLSAGGGGGGAGGYGAVVTGTGNLGTLNVAATGGNGGRGGPGFPFPGDGGSGGIGLLLNNPLGGSLIVNAKVAGGQAGLAGPGSALAVDGSPGAGIVGRNLAIIIGPSGTVTATTTAIQFTGGDNFVTFSNATSGLTGGIVLNGVRSLTFDQSGSGVTVANSISGSGPIVKTGSAAVDLTGTNSYTAGTVLRQGVLGISTDAALGIPTGALNFDGGTLRFLGGFALSEGRHIELDEGGGTIDTQNFDAPIVQPLSGPGSLTKLGTSELTLQGANTYLGNTEISEGTLTLAGNGSVSDSNQVIVGGTFNIAETGDTSIETLSGDGAVLLGRQNLTITEGGHGDTANIYAGSISGTGGLTMKGGHLTLSGASTYSGPTNVTGGELQVSGSLAGTPVTVASGATLSGAGTIAGAVTVDAGGSVAPSISPSPGVFTLGSLTLEPGSMLNYTLGFVGGTNDRIDVTGNLTLLGATLLNITDLGGFGNGGFSSGVYSLFNYGTLTGDPVDDLELGALPPTVSAMDRNRINIIDDMVHHQIQLVSAVGLVTNFWNGSANSGSPGGVLDGGTGVWSTENHNWADAGLTVNSTWQKQFAIFGGTAGTVSVEGEVPFDGMQFMVDGYRVVQGDGGLLMTNETETVMRVDSGDTAEVAAPIAGSGGLVKRDFGTLVLSGTNSYTGGTTIDEGVLEVSADDNLGAVTAPLTFDGGTLRYDAGFASARSVTLEESGGTIDTQSDSAMLSGAISGPGELIKTGPGTLTLTNDNTYTGGTTILAGTLQLGDGGDTGSIAGDIRNDGLLVLDRSGTLTLPGEISGSGAVTQLGTGTTVLLGESDYFGPTTIAAGVLKAGVKDAFSPFSAHTIAAGAVLDLGGFSEKIGSLAGAGRVTSSAAGAVTLTTNDNDDASTTFSGVIDNGSGTLALTKEGIGTLTLTGDNTYTGGTTIAAGTLKLGNGGTKGSILGNVLTDGVLTFDRSDTVTFPGAISGSGEVEILGSGTTILTGNNTYEGGTIIAAGTLQLGNGGTKGSIVGDVINDGTLVFDRSDTVTFPGTISGSGDINFIGAGTTILTSDTDSFATNVTIAAGSLVVGDQTSQDTTLNTDPITVAAGATLGGYGTVTGDVNNAGTIAVADAVPALAGGEKGVFTIIGDLTNAGLLQVAGAGVGNILEVEGNYIGQNGRLALNAFLNTDTEISPDGTEINSPSDLFVILGPDVTASGSTKVFVTNVGGPGALTTHDGIPLIALLDASSTPGAFSLGAPVVAGPFEYELFRGGVTPGTEDSWFLRSDFACPSPPGRPPELLPPGVCPIIGPYLTTYSVVQPIARQLGLAQLGTLHERVGDTLTAAYPEGGGAGRSGWVRFFGQGIDNRYQAFADPRASGQLFGFQAGFDLWRGSLLPGHSDAAGVYFAYGNVSADTSGIVTNSTATGYVLQRTGTVNLNAFSGGAYWTHYGPGGWYLDAVLQGTGYSGSASAQFSNPSLSTNLPTNGSGLITSLEAGYPIPLAFGPNFILEPQAQILWQHVSFASAGDGLQTVELGSSSGATGRLGVRGRWTIPDVHGGIWQPYARANLWQDWGGASAVAFGNNPVKLPLIQQATRLEFNGGATYRFNSSLSFFVQAGYQFAVSPSDIRRDAVEGDIGLRITW